MLFGAVAALGLLFLLLSENLSAAGASEATFLDASFEVSSALGTVGLSTGVTPGLTGPSKVILMILMLTGRLGPISIYLALSRVEEKGHLSFPEEDVLIG